MNAQGGHEFYSRNPLSFQGNSTSSSLLKSMPNILTKTLPIFFLATLFAEEAVDGENIIILDAQSEKSLQLKVESSVEGDFEQTLFAIGRVQEVPTNHSVISSRIPGRVTELHFIAGDEVEKGELVMKIESRQAGDPPPTISLTAPSSGIVAESHVRLGEPVSPENELMDILDLSQVWAVARVPEQEAGKLAVGTLARIRIAALQEQILEGKLIRFGTHADPTSSTIDAIFLVDNPENRLRPGMRAEFSIITSARKNVTAVPLKAVQGDPGKRVVYVKDFELDHVYHKSPVITGEKNDQFIEIKEGIFPGDEVVTTGSYLLGFAGKSDVSLKETLDAAHGHEHNEDGSEMTEADKKAAEAAHDHEHGHDHDEAEHHDGENLTQLRFFQSLSGILLILLLVSSLKRPKPEKPNQHDETVASLQIPDFPILRFQILKSSHSCAPNKNRLSLKSANPPLRLEKIK